MNFDHYFCESHQVQQHPILQKTKIKMYCPKCAQHNILKQKQFAYDLKNDMTLLEMQRIKEYETQQILSMLVAFYLQIMPLFFSAVGGVFSQRWSFSDGLIKGYQLLWTNPIGIALSLSMFAIGAGFTINAHKKIAQIFHQKKEVSIEKAVEDFQKLHRQDVMQFIKQKEIEMLEYLKRSTSYDKMTDFEFVVQIAQLLKNDFDEVKLSSASENFGVSFCTTLNNEKIAYFVTKEQEHLHMNKIRKFAIGRAYYECKEAILLTLNKLPEDLKMYAEDLQIICQTIEEYQQKKSEFMYVAVERMVEEMLDFSDQALHTYFLEHGANSLVPITA